MANYFEKFETLQREALVLQEWATMEDGPEAINTVNELTSQIDIDVLIDVPVTLSGGDIQVQAMASNYETSSISNVFVPNNGQVSGQYYRLVWLPERMNLPNDTENTVIWRLCHALQQPGVSYINNDGSLVTEFPMDYVTVEGSSFQINTASNAHDQKLLAEDVFCLKLDQVLLDENKSLHDKLGVVASMFTIEGYYELSNKKRTLYDHRLSYLNSLAILGNAVVQTPIALKRDDEDTTSILALSESSSFIRPEYLSLDWECTSNGDIADGSQTLSFEFNIAGMGNVSAPYIKGVTKVFELEA